MKGAYQITLPLFLFHTLTLSHSLTIIIKIIITYCVLCWSPNCSNQCSDIDDVSMVTCERRSVESTTVNLCRMHDQHSVQFRWVHRRYFENDNRSIVRDCCSSVWCAWRCAMDRNDSDLSSNYHNSHRQMQLIDRMIAMTADYMCSHENCICRMAWRASWLRACELVRRQYCMSQALCST